MPGLLRPAFNLRSLEYEFMAYFLLGAPSRKLACLG